MGGENKGGGLKLEIIEKMSRGKKSKLGWSDSPLAQISF